MSETELANAAWWAWLWGEIEHWAFLAVVIALAIEFAALKFGAPYKEKLEHARELAVAAATERAANAELELEKFKAPRSMSPEQQANVASRMSVWMTIPKSGLPQSVAVFAVDPSFEAATLSNQIAATLGPEGAKWSVNRYPVTYGKTYMAAGVAILTSSNPRGIAVATALATALHDNGIAAFVMDEKRIGCEDIDGLKDRVDTDPACSAVSVMVGEKLRE